LKDVAKVVVVARVLKVRKAGEIEFCHILTPVTFSTLTTFKITMPLPLAPQLISSFVTWQSN
jgi:hypothetical protein